MAVDRRIEGEVLRSSSSQQGVHAAQGSQYMPLRAIGSASQQGDGITTTALKHTGRFTIARGSRSPQVATQPSDDPERSLVSPQMR